MVRARYPRCPLARREEEARRQPKPLTPHFQFDSGTPTFRADAAFAKPEIYDALEQCGVDYVIRIPANRNSCFVRRAGRAQSPWCAWRGSERGTGRSSA